jgi:Tfp pilus assembly protein PilO
MRLKRYIVIVILALLLIGMAYIHALFSHQNQQGRIPPEASSSLPTELIDEYIKKVDAAARFDSLRNAYADSVDRMEQRMTARLDSLPAYDLDSLQREIERLAQKLLAAQTEADRITRDKSAHFEKMVMAFYRGEIENLPDDLSRYEYNVSLKEIRAKAMNYFNISSEELNRIVKKY